MVQTRTQISAVSERAHKPGHYLRWNQKLVETRTGAAVESRKLTTLYFTLITYQISTAADRRGNSFSPENGPIIADHRDTYGDT